MCRGRAEPEEEAWITETSEDTLTKGYEWGWGSAMSGLNAAKEMAAESEASAVAAASRRVAVLRYLGSVSAKLLGEENVRGETPAHIAARNGDVPCLLVSREHLLA